MSLTGNVRGWEVHKTSCLLDVHLNNIILLLSAVKWNLTLCVSGWEIYLETTPLVRWQTVSPGRELIHCQPVSLCPALSSWSLCGSMPKIYWALQCPSPSTTPSVTLVRQQQWVFGEFVRCMATSAQRVCCFMCNDTTQLFVSHEITMMLWMELETSFAVKGVLLLCSKLEVYDKWWLSLMANNDVMESYLFKRCKFFFGGGIFIHLNSDAIDSWSWPTRLLFPRVHHPSEAVCEDSKPGDPIQSRSTDVDLISRLSKTSQQFRLLQEI